MDVKTSRANARSSSRFPAQNFDDLSDNLQLSLVRAGENDWREASVDRFERNFRMVPRVPVARLLALITLNGVTLAAFRVGDVAHLHEHRLPLARALYGRSEEAVRAIRNARLHGLPNHLGDEHTATEAACSLDRYPHKVIVVNVLGVAECAAAALRGTRGTQVT